MARSGHGDIGNARGCTVEGVSTKEIARSKIKMVGTAQALTCIQLGEAKRRYPAHFVSKLTDCDGENGETDTWLDYALDCEYISAETHAALVREVESVGKMLGTILKKAADFTDVPED